MFDRPALVLDARVPIWSDGPGDWNALLVGDADPVFGEHWPQLPPRRATFFDVLRALRHNET